MLLSRLLILLLMTGLAACQSLAPGADKRELRRWTELSRTLDSDALAERLARAAAESPNRAGVVRAGLQLAHGKLEEGDPNGAAHLYEALITAAARPDAPANPLLAEALHGLADAKSYLALPDEAEGLYRRALALRADLYGADSPGAAADWIGLADLYAARADPEQALEYANRALSIQQDKLGPRAREVAQTLGKIAAILCSFHDYSQANRTAVRALTIIMEAPTGNLVDSADVLSVLAKIALESGFEERARVYFEDAMRACEIGLGPRHPCTAQKRNDLALFYGSRGMNTKARELFRGALATLQGSLGPDHPDVGQLLVNWATCEERAGDSAQAEKLLRRALEILKTTYGSEHEQVLVVRQRIEHLREAQAVTPAVNRGEPRASKRRL